MENQKPTTDDVDKWLERQGEKGDIAVETARGKRTAVKTLAAMRSDEEPQHLEWIVENAELLANRWARKNNGNSDTARIYAQRGTDAIKDFVSYWADPAGYTAAIKSKLKVAKPKPKVAKMESTKAPIEVQPVETGMNHFHIGLEDGSPFDMKFSKTTKLTQRDLQRIGGLLTSFADNERYAPNNGGDPTLPPAQQQ